MSHTPSLPPSLFSPPLLSSPPAMLLLCSPLSLPPTLLRQPWIHGGVNEVAKPPSADPSVESGGRVHCGGAEAGRRRPWPRARSSHGHRWTSRRRTNAPELDLRRPPAPAVELHQ
jgi:hypothetical protein